jgi:hypothetical protein
LRARPAFGGWVTRCRGSHMVLADHGGELPAGAMTVETLGGLVLALLFGFFALVRFGFFVSRYQHNALRDWASARQYEQDANGTIRTYVNERRFDISFFAIPGHSHKTEWKVRSAEERSVGGMFAVRPKHESEPADLRTGDLLFDSCFLVSGVSRSVAARVLDDAVRKSLIQFGPRGAFEYDDGALTFAWETVEPFEPADVELALNIVVLAARAAAQDST